MKSPGDTFPLIFYSALSHPDKSFRVQLMDSIRSWVDTLDPVYTEDQIQTVINNCTGTILEPFLLNNQDIEISTILIRMAFSKAFNQTRFRLVSRETLGSEGGCVLTNNLKHYYVERFELGHHKKSPANSWSFVPNNFPDNLMEKLRPMLVNASKQSNSLDAEISVDDSGYKIMLQGIDLNNLRWPDTSGLAGDLQKNSTVGDKKESLLSLGIRVEIFENELKIQTASPESMMRFTAYLLDGTLLVLDPGEQVEGRFKIHLPISLPEDDKLSIKPTVTVTNNPFSEWLNVSPGHAPELSKSEQLKLSKWLIPHDSWVDHKFMEEII